MIEVTDYGISGWTAPAEQRSREYCARLEEGEILLFRGTPFQIPPEDLKFLLDVRQSSAAFHKNVSYRPREDRVYGVKRGGASERQLAGIFGRYSKSVTEFGERFLQPYPRGWKLDFASFRSIEERGRNLPLKSRNDLLHVDAFPTRPTHGDRILRIFTNLNPVESRVWLTGEPFDVLAPRLAPDAGLEHCARLARSRWRSPRRLLPFVANVFGLPLPDRSPYDRFMLGFHDYLKANRDFQERSPKMRCEFPPNSTWIVFTDSVPHAVLSGRMALEHTYIISEEDLVLPEKSPRRVLERLCGTPLRN